MGEGEKGKSEGEDGRWGGILEYCRVSKQGQEFLERDRGMGSDIADRNIGERKRVRE